MIQREFELLEKLRTEKPLIHCITNHVVSNFQANGLLALGASPIMGEAPEEMEELARMSSALSLNIGTLNKQSLDSMLLAGKAANLRRIPVILDPVGVGASRFRVEAVRKILGEVDVAVLRCNAGELAAIAGAGWHSKGVDAGEGSADVAELAQDTASVLGLVVAVTGEMDFVTDGRRILEISYGDALMASVTGMGCLLSSVVAAFNAINPEDALESTAGAVKFYGIAGELAGSTAALPGTFQQMFLDKLHSLQKEEAADFIGRKDEMKWQ